MFFMLSQLAIRSLEQSTNVRANVFSPAPPLLFVVCFCVNTLLLCLPLSVHVYSMAVGCSVAQKRGSSSSNTKNLKVLHNSTTKSSFFTMRKFDLIIFGASGFTGRYVVERLVQQTLLQKSSSSHQPTRWAIAVRSPAKMRAYLREMEARTGVADLEAKVPVLAADVTDLASMRRAFSQGQLVMSCIGPYSLLGEPVLRAAIDARAHYLDLSGEPLFMERVVLQYDQAARDSEVFAVSSCGFDSIPSDVGTQYLKGQFSARGGGHLGTVEHYLETAFHPANRYSFASWVSLIEGFKHADQLREVRRRLFSQFGPLYKPYHYPLVQKRHRLRLDPHRGYIAPFPGSDRSVVKRTQLYRYQVLNEEPVQFEAYYCMPTWRHLLLTALMSLNLAVLSRTALGDRLLRQYAHLFSLGFFSEGTLPNHDTLPYDLFTISLVGRGWPKGIAPGDRHQGNMTAKGTLLIRGSNLAYIDTSTIAVHAALTLLEQLRCAPLKVPFGVVTPASILDPQLLIPRLNQNGVLFDYLEE